MKRRETIFSEREQFSGKTAEIIESALAETITDKKLMRGGLILIAAAAYLSFPPDRRWSDARERRNLGMEKSSVPEPSNWEICAAQAGEVTRCRRPLWHLGEHAQYGERGDFGPMNETCLQCHTTKIQSGAYCDSCRVMLSVWGC